MAQQDDEPEKAKFLNFLRYYDLAKHHESFVKIGVHKLSHLKHTKDEDLKEIGLTRPEIARLNQKVKENFSTVGKWKKKIRGKDHNFEISETGNRRGSMVFDSSFNGSYNVINSPIVISSSQIKLLDKIGEGSNGSVHEADMTLRDNKLRVAAKCVMGLDESAMSHFMKEAESMVQLDHPHIIKLYGISIGTPLMIIEELASLGNLYSYLKTNSVRLHLGNLYTFIIQTASAMCYLEEKRLIHRDLATRNVLVSSPDLVKLGDFGLARKLTECGNYQLTHNVPLPTAWMPPEAITNGIFSAASDVWSFGVLMWELYSKGEKPWAGYVGREIVDRLEIGKQLDKPNICPQQVYMLMKTCWALKPDDRPSFSSLYKKLQEPRYRPEVGYVTKSHSVDDELYLNKDDLVFVIDKYPRNNLCVCMTLKGEITTFRSEYVKMDFMRINKELHTADVPVHDSPELRCNPYESLVLTPTSVVDIKSDGRSSSPDVPGHYETRINNPGVVEERREIDGRSSSPDVLGHYETRINNPGVVEERREITPNDIGSGVYSTAEEYDEQEYNGDDDDFYIQMRSPQSPAAINLLDKPTELNLPPPLAPTPTQTTPQTTPQNIPKLDHHFREAPEKDQPAMSGSSNQSSNSNLDIDKESLYYYITRSQTSEPYNVSHDPPPIPPRLSQKSLDESPPLLRPHPLEIEPNTTFNKDSLYKVIFKEFPNTSRSIFNRIAEQCDWNIETIRDKFKIRQLMEMHFPYIEETDCIRALEHCQGKVDRAAAWLIDVSETISARRSQV